MTSHVIFPLGPLLYQTGTLTTNQMSVQKIMSIESHSSRGLKINQWNVEGDTFSPIGDIYEEGSSAPMEFPACSSIALEEIGKICTLCNESSILWKEATASKPAGYGISGAPTEAALKVLSEKIGVPDEEQAEKVFTSEDPQDRLADAHNYWNSYYARVQLLEFDRHRKSMSVIVEDDEGYFELLCKGAPEKILERCTHYRDGKGKAVKLTKAVTKELLEIFEQYADEGLRCLGLAVSDTPDREADFTKLELYEKVESDMTFAGLVCMLDPPRQEVSASIAKCRLAGVKVIVITGDNPVTAESICRRIGVFGEDEDIEGKSFTGADLEQMTPKEKQVAVANALLFSRVEPRHKSELVALLKGQGHVVAMTGDGVNDAPALRAADIGVAMGSGTDVAREASDMILQDDNFATIVMAVEEGRSIYANTQSFIRYAGYSFARNPFSFTVLFRLFDMLCWRLC